MVGDRQAVRTGWPQSDARGGDFMFEENGHSMHYYFLMTAQRAAMSRMRRELAHRPDDVTMPGMIHQLKCH